MGRFAYWLREGKPDFNALLFGRRIPVFVAFDLLYYEREDIWNLPLKERRALLGQIAKRYRVHKVGTVYRVR